jgi:hypothetical protein
MAGGQRIPPAVDKNLFNTLKGVWLLPLIDTSGRIFVCAACSMPSACIGVVGALYLQPPFFALSATQIHSGSPLRYSVLWCIYFLGADLVVGVMPTVDLLQPVTIENHHLAVFVLPGVILVSWQVWTLAMCA